MGECYLSDTKSSSGVPSLSQLVVHATEQRRDGVVIDFPQSPNDVAGARSQKSPGDTGHPFDVLGIASHRSAGGENHERRVREVKRSNGVCIEIAVLVCPVGREME